MIADTRTLAPANSTSNGILEVKSAIEFYKEPWNEESFLSLISDTENYGGGESRNRANVKLFNRCQAIHY